MIEIKGISISELSFSIKEFVGVLLFEEFPVTTIYSGYSNIPIIKEWIDCDGEIDRFFFYQASQENLKKFLKGNISQGELLNTSFNDQIFIVDEINGQASQLKIVSSSQIPNEYLPPKDSFFNVQNGVQTQNIIDYFNLENIKKIPLKVDR